MKEYILKEISTERKADYKIDHEDKINSDRLETATTQNGTMLVAAGAGNARTRVEPEDKDEDKLILSNTSSQDSQVAYCIYYVAY